MYCMDWEDIEPGKDVPWRSIDLIFADLPFNIDIGHRTKTRDRGYDAKVYGDNWEDWAYQDMLETWFNKAWNVLKEEGAMVCFSGWNHLDSVLYAAGGESFHLQGHCIIKYPFGIYTKKRYVTSHYHALWWTRSKRKWTFNKTKDYMEDVWDATREFKAKELGHPCPTTVSWIMPFIEVHSNPGETVLDFCMGVGGTAIACLETGRHYLGYEVEAEYVQTAKKRVFDWQSARSAERRSSRAR